MHLGDRLKDLRKQLKLSQVEFASLIGCSQYALCRWEKQNRVPKINYLLKIKKLAKMGGIILNDDFFIT